MKQSRKRGEKGSARERGRKQACCAFRAHIFRFLLLPEKTDGRAMADGPSKWGPPRSSLRIPGPPYSPSFPSSPFAPRRRRLIIPTPSASSSRYLLAIAGMMRLNQYHQRRRANTMTTIMTMTTVVRFPQPPLPYVVANARTHTHARGLMYYIGREYHL